MIKTYIKKPVKIQAVQWTGDNILEIQEFQKKSDNPNAMYWTKDDEILIDTKRGNMLASIGDYLMLTDHGEIFPCKPKTFESKYEEVEEGKTLMK